MGRNMKQRDLRRLEFDKVLNRLANHTRSQIGKELVESHAPSKNIIEIRRWQAETTEGKELLRLDPAFDIGGWNDVREEVKRASREIVLEPNELESIGKTISAAKRIKKFFAEKQSLYPLLSQISLGLGYFNELEKQITKAILPGGEIADNASPDLSSIRRRLTSGRLQIKERLDKIVRSPDYQKYLQDSLVTIREGRYVIPVKQEYRSMISGIVHDQSASGATIFIEPMAVVEASNEVRRLEAEERQEIFKILTALTKSVAAHSNELAYTLETLGQLDFIMARARYSDQLNAWAPKISEEYKLNIQKGRHPLLAGEVVPISTHLGIDFQTLVITGPNTGGKTVTLKTVGLLVLMAQAGLHIPAGEGTIIGVLNNVFADIGDEQSIEQSLSTFSSHMTNIVNVLNIAVEGSLVLLDELGAGTDPAEGSAIAQAVLEYLHEAGALTIATTHYSELKNFAYSREGVENASVEFDPVTLKPTYKLLIGKPGRSNAFEIASRLGLSNSIVEKAKSFMTTEQLEVAQILNELEIARHQAATEQIAAEKLRLEAQILKDRYLKEEEKLNNRRQEIIEKSRSEAREIVRKAKYEAEEIIKQLKQAMAEESERNRERLIHNARQKIKSIQGKYAYREKKVPRGGMQVPDKVEPGMEVYVPRFGQNGVVLEVAGDNKDVLVQVGMIKVKLSSGDLSVIEKEALNSTLKSVNRLIKGKALEITSKLDLRGMRAADAIVQVDKYLDDAGLAGLGKVYIVHGKGTGVLREVIHKQLKNHKDVKSFRLGEHGEGGSGITVVEIK